MIERGSSHKRKVNGILGVLCRRHFPGMVSHHGIEEPAYTFDHYFCPKDDTRDQQCRLFPNKAERVLAELWVSSSR